VKTAVGTLAAPFLPVIFRGRVVIGYRVSSDGLVFSDKSEKFLKPSLVGGYLALSLCRDGAILRAYIHHLVAEAFIGPRPDNFDVCHNDGIRHHNFVENLRYASRSDNLADREMHGTSQRGERNPSAKLTDRQADEIRVRRAAGEPLKILAAEFGVREPAISRIANGKRRTLA